MARLKPCLCGCGALIDSSTVRKYASHKCRSKAYRDRNKNRHQSRPFRDARVCAYCGKSYVAIHPLQRSCSRAHRQALYRELKKLADGEHI